MKREALRVEPISSYLERWGRPPGSPVTRAGNMIFVSGLPPFDPETGDILPAPIERQTELVLEQMKLCLAAAGASLDNVMKCNVYCTSAKHFAAVNSVSSPAGSNTGGWHTDPEHSTANDLPKPKVGRWGIVAPKTGGRFFSTA